MVLHDFWPQHDDLLVERSLVSEEVVKFAAWLGGHAVDLGCDFRVGGRHQLDSVCQVELVSVVGGRIVARRDHHTGIGPAHQHGVGQNRCRQRRIDQLGNTTSSDHHSGGLASEDSRSVPSVVADDNGCPVGQPSHQSRGGLTNHEPIHERRTGSHRGPQTSRAKANAPTEQLGKGVDVGLVDQFGDVPARLRVRIGIGPVPRDVHDSCWVIHRWHSPTDVSAPSDDSPIRAGRRVLGVNVCALVRSSCREAATRFEKVTIDETRIDHLAAELADDPLANRPHRPETETKRATMATDEAAALLVFALDAINFGSGYHDIVRKRPNMSGAVTMSTSLRDYVAFTGPLTGERLRRITQTDCSQIFGQELDDGALSELMSRFATALNDLGHWLSDSGDSALTAIETSDFDAPTLAGNLTAMPFFRDVEILDGSQIHFYKRAQIAAADLARELPHLRLARLAELTAFADNLVPHVLRVDGVLRYDESLAARIDNRELLEPGSREEIEIRAAGVVVVEALSARLDQRAMDVDLALWTRGGQPAYKAIPRHRARSVFY